MRDRLYKTNGLILRRSDIGEADRLLVLCTPSGKRRIVARGVRKTTSRLAGHIELFTHTTMMLAKGRTFDIVTQSQVIAHFPTLHTDLLRLGGAYYVAELYDVLTQEEENPPLFSLLLQTFHALDSTRTLNLVLRAYEVRLLHVLGYRPHLQRCVVCQNRLTEHADRFSPSLGGVLCPDDARADPAALPMSLGAFKVLRHVQKSPFEALERLTISTQVADEVMLLLRAYLRHILERELKTAAFLDTLHQQTDA